MKKRVLITGSNRGIGKKLVEKLAQEGFEIVACARKKEKEFEEFLYNTSLQYNVEIITSYFDMEDEQCLKEELKRIVCEVKRIDVLINNAGYSTNSLFSMTSSKELKKAMQINYFSPIIISQIISRTMIKNGGGCIINIASVSGIKNEKGRLAYGSSKAALIFASKTMSMELAKDNIRVNCISPGFIDTDMWKNRNVELYNQVLSETPMGRQGKTDDIANIVSFLISDSSSYITGQNIIVDGGRMI